MSSSNRIELNIIALSQSESSPGNYALAFEEDGGVRRLVIVIGLFEAQAIAVSLEKMQPTRPLTHDLFKNFLDIAGVRIKEVLIDKIEDDIYFAKLIGQIANGDKIAVDARTSDAIALAVRYGCPIYTTEEVMSAAGFVSDGLSNIFTNKRGKLADYTLTELQLILEQVLAKEDYESATKIRDAINQKRKEEED